MAQGERPAATNRHSLIHVAITFAKHLQEAYLSVGTPDQQHHQCPDGRIVGLSGNRRTGCKHKFNRKQAIYAGGTWRLCRFWRRRGQLRFLWLFFRSCWDCHCHSFPVYCVRSTSLQVKRSSKQYATGSPGLTK